MKYIAACGMDACVHEAASLLARRQLAGSGATSSDDRWKVCQP